MQAKLTALAVNLKRIAALVSFLLAYLHRILSRNGFLPEIIMRQAAITV
jgi:hypothetical protein